MKKKHQILILKAELGRLSKIIGEQEVFLKLHHKHAVITSNNDGEMHCAFCGMILEDDDFEKVVDFFPELKHK